MAVPFIGSVSDDNSHLVHLPLSLLTKIENPELRLHFSTKKRFVVRITSTQNHHQDSSYPSAAVSAPPRSSREEHTLPLSDDFIVDVDFGNFGSSRPDHSTEDGGLTTSRGYQAVLATACWDAASSHMIGGQVSQALSPDHVRHIPDWMCRVLQSKDDEDGTVCTIRGICLLFCQQLPVVRRVVVCESSNQKIALMPVQLRRLRHERKLRDLVLFAGLNTSEFRVAIVDVGGAEGSLPSAIVGEATKIEWSSEEAPPHLPLQSTLMAAKERFLTLAPHFRREDADRPVSARVVGYYLGPGVAMAEFRHQFASAGVWWTLKDIVCAGSFTRLRRRMKETGELWVDVSHMSGDLVAGLTAALMAGRDEDESDRPRKRSTTATTLNCVCFSSRRDFLDVRSCTEIFDVRMSLPTTSAVSSDHSATRGKDGAEELPISTTTSSSSSQKVLSKLLATLDRELRRLGGPPPIHLVSGGTGTGGGLSSGGGPPPRHLLLVGRRGKSTLLHALGQVVGIEELVASGVGESPRRLRDMLLFASSGATASGGGAPWSSKEITFGDNKLLLGASCLCFDDIDQWLTGTNLWDQSMVPEFAQCLDTLKQRGGRGGASVVAAARDISKVPQSLLSRLTLVRLSDEDFGG